MTKTEAAFIITAILREFDEDLRDEVMGMVFEKFCRHCWRRLKNKADYCWCWRDE